MTYRRERAAFASLVSVPEFLLGYGGEGFVRSAGGGTPIRPRRDRVRRFRRTAIVLCAVILAIAVPVAAFSAVPDASDVQGVSESQLPASRESR